MCEAAKTWNWQGRSPPPLQQGKKHKGVVKFEILKNPCIDFYSGFRGNAQGGGGAIGNPPKNVGIDFYSGFRKKFQVYTFIVASGKPLKGGGAILIPKKVGPP